MRLYIPDMDEFFNFMHINNLKYVVLRSHKELKNKYPNKGSKDDIDLLIESKAIDIIYDKYKFILKQFGIKCDIYSDEYDMKTNYLGNTYLPENLAKNMLINRYKYNDKFYIAEDKYYFLALLYHIVYQKHDTSKISFYSDETKKSTKYDYYIDYFCKNLDIEKPTCLYEMHKILLENNYNISQKVLRDYIVHDYKRIANKHDKRSYTYMYLQNELFGEMNLFVIRRIAVKKKSWKMILNELKKYYEVLYIKKIDFITRFTTRKKMRGGKWKRGGYPYIAIVLFDNSPNETSSLDRKVHPMVLNSKQFVKKDIRERFSKDTNTKIKLNPLHSTDNESEAIGHLNLYFNEIEIKEIYEKLDSKRR